MEVITLVILIFVILIFFRLGFIHETLKDSHNKRNTANFESTKVIVEMIAQSGQAQVDATQRQIEMLSIIAKRIITK